MPSRCSRRKIAASAIDRTALNLSIGATRKVGIGNGLKLRNRCQQVAGEGNSSTSLASERSRQRSIPKERMGVKFVAVQQQDRARFVRWLTLLSS